MDPDPDSNIILYDLIVNTPMEERFSYLKTNFNTIIDFKESNILTMQILTTRIKKIKEIYGEFISINRERLFIFTLDSFYFQSKLIDIEYEDMTRMFHAITNRMYCDYYKLFKIIVEYVVENVPDKKLVELIKVNNNYPVYKDLEPFKQYDFQYIQSLHEIILVILIHLHGYILKKEHDLHIYQTKNKIGLNIDNFVNTFNFNTIIMKEKCNLFMSYIEFFHVLHTKYFKRFTMKMHLMLNQINNDIRFDNPNESEKAKKDIVKELKENHIDRDILRELQESIDDDTFTVGGDTLHQTEASIETETNEHVSDLSDDKSKSASPLLEFANMEFANMEFVNMFSSIQNNIQISPVNESSNDYAVTISTCVSDIIDKIAENIIV